MIVRKNVGGPTSLFEVLPDDVYNELIPQLKKDVGNLMFVSQRVYRACAKARLGWTALLPERYRWVPNPRKIVIDAWKEEQNIKRAAGCIEGYLPRREGVLSWKTSSVNWSGYCVMANEVVDRIISLSPWKARDSKSEITLSEITKWIAIETLLTYAIELTGTFSIHDGWLPIGDDELYSDISLRTIGGVALLAKEYLSPRLFHMLLRKSNLIFSFFALFNGCPTTIQDSMDSTQWKDLARFVLERYCPIGVCACWPKDIQRIETWFGSELQELSTEYRIFGVQGFAATKAFDSLEISKWKQFLLQSMWGSTGPREVPLSYLQSLVRVSKYVFHDPEQLVRFILSIARKGHEKVLLEVGVDTSFVNEFLVDFERRLKGMIEHVVEHDDVPFCPNPEYEKDRDFVDGALGPYLIEKFVRAPWQ